MFKFRSEQMAAFDPQSDEEIVACACEFLRREFDEELADITDERLEELAWVGIHRAKPYYFKSAVDRMMFIVLMFDVAPNFDSHPLIRRELRSPRHPPDARVEAVLRATKDETWIEVELAYDESAWDEDFAVEPEKR